MRSTVIAIAILTGLLELVPSTASPQAGRGEINGTAFDEGKGVLAGVTITATSEEQGTTRVTLDSMAEFQVLTHQYTAEHGGASGMIVNAVSKSGTSQMSDRAFYYKQDGKSPTAGTPRCRTFLAEATTARSGSATTSRSAPRIRSRILHGSRF